MALTGDDNCGSGSAKLDFESVVQSHYAAVYRFAYSLARNEAGAADLTQETFHIWAVRGGQLRDPAKVKAWLFTTLHREFLASRRRQERFPHQEIGIVEHELPPVDPEQIRALDGATVLALLARVDPQFQAPVALFYLEDYSYKEIAEILDIPLGTVKSRIARGLAQLQALVCERPTPKSTLT